MVNVKLKGVTILPIVLALTFMFFISAIVFGVIVGVYLGGLESNIREAQEHSQKTKQNIIVYIYNTSLCKMMNLVTKALKRQEIKPEDTDMSGPMKILILNQGGQVVELDYIAISALGSKVYEDPINIKLKPGDYIVFSPRELNLPEDYKKLMGYLDVIVIHGGRETYQNVAYNPPPLTLINIDERGVCSEP